MPAKKKAAAKKRVAKKRPAKKKVVVPIESQLMAELTRRYPADTYTSVIVTDKMASANCPEHGNVQVTPEDLK